MFYFPGSLAQWHPRSPIRSGDPDPIHVPYELRQVPHGRPDLQVPGNLNRSEPVSSAF
jgi:hypothetical protein